VTWEKSVDDLNILRYEIMRSENIDTGYTIMGSVLRGMTEFADNQGITNGRKYYYLVRAVGKEGISESNYGTYGIASAQWFHKARTNVFILVIVFSFFILWYIRRAKRGEHLYIRKIAGLEAVDEAVGRSTELGKPVLFISGLAYISDPTTIAALTILGRVAKKTAEYDVPLLVPNYDPLVMTAAQEIVKESYQEAGRPDAYREKNITFLTQDQFGFAAGCDGIMLRQKPGAIFLQGTFFAESLILAETGHSVGAIQIAGTTQTAQLPFFVAACDYTLIGEEMYAASSYLSHEPLMLGSLKGEDTIKAIILFIVGVSAILGTIGVILSRHGTNNIMNLFNIIVNWFGRV
jgi:hypothetical protein